MTLLETARLTMRPFEAADAEEAFGWFGDPQLMRYVPTGPDPSIERTRARMGMPCVDLVTAPVLIR